MLHDATGDANDLSLDAPTLDVLDRQVQHVLVVLAIGVVLATWIYKHL